MLTFSSETSLNLKLKGFITQGPLHTRQGKSLNPYDGSQGTAKIKSLLTQSLVVKLKSHFGAKKAHCNMKR